MVMADSYGSKVLPTHAIYPSSRLARYAVLLVVFKVLRSFGLFLAYDILKWVHVVQFLFIVKLGSSLCLLILQKPFSLGKKLSKNQYFRVAKHAFFGTIINLLWMFGLTLCGPLRTILLFEHSDLVILTAAGAIFASNGGPSKMRGAVFFLLAVSGVLFFDHDEVHKSADHPEGHHSSIMTHLFYHMVSWTGMSDHMGGVVLLFFTLCLNTGFNSASKKLSLDIGGAKRLNALSSLFSCFYLLPWASFIYFTKDKPLEWSTSLILPFIIVILSVFLADYYVEAVCVNHLEIVRSARIASAAMFVSGLLLSCFWSNPLLLSQGSGRPIAVEEHALSGGVIFSFVLFLFAINILTGPNRGSKASFIGYSIAGEPLYSYASHALQKTSHSVYTIARNGMGKILSDPDSRKIFYFLCINLGFTFVELIYGAWTNSLGLISDGFHMLFDCSALVMGLYASVMSKWTATRIFSYGYDRFEVLSGYINGLFLVVISFFVFTEALTRLYDPPTINTERLFTVSVAGLLVNLVGIFAFRHAHSHGGGHGHSHGAPPPKPAAHGHSHGAGGSHSNSVAHGHSHGGQACSSHEPVKHHNTNMEGVFLHILADTLGSVGVIISTLLIENFGLNIADPICSLFIAIMIFLSVIPLLKETAMILVLRTPSDMQKEIADCLHKILSLDGVISIRDQHFWEHSSVVTCSTLHIIVRADVSEQHTVSQVTHLLKEIGVNNLTIQVEKEAYYQHLSGLGSNLGSDVIMQSRNINYSNNGISTSIKAI